MKSPNDKDTGSIMTDLTERYPQLRGSVKDISKTCDLIHRCYDGAGKLLVCGNGGSAADADHIVGELMKTFVHRKPLSDEIQIALTNTSTDRGAYLGQNLQPALSAISLTTHTALNTAMSNDVDAQLIFAQQVLGFGQKGDVLLAISTSGNSGNVVDAVITARALGLVTIGLTGKDGGKLKSLCDVSICVNATDVAEIQELHRPVYHALCKMLEIQFFGN